MKKAELLKVFINDYVRIKSGELYKRLMEYYIDNWPSIVHEFCQSFFDLCHMIENPKKGTVYYIQYSMMLNRLLKEKPAYVVEAFGESFFLEPPIAECIYDPSWLTKPLLSFYDDIRQEARRYMLSITEIEVERLFITELKFYENLIWQVAEDSIEKLLDSDEYKLLDYNESGVIELRLGEYRGDSKLLITKTRKLDEIWSKINELLLNQTGQEG